ncbi:hypothetical protein [Pedobacter endophyticus]|uniref:Uncharacterized protein n=1 Tax=Pedobacter endophyticus TaxID=2789740 RepID=A0A7U3Q4F3_9SPHI|nr:hypothetical protein [Pedobacter endophyticus]QPH38410.1 hypothetical protein IZT61_15135 [Pedobacter endophyticus]
MNQHIQNKIQDLKKAAKISPTSATPVSRNFCDEDSLGKVIRTKNDAEHFMSELNAIYKRSK